jgi:hypothetical protein
LAPIHKIDRMGRPLVGYFEGTAISVFPLFSRTRQIETGGGSARSADHWLLSRVVRQCMNFSLLKTRSPHQGPNRPHDRGMDRLIDIVAVLAAVLSLLYAAVEYAAWRIGVHVKRALPPPLEPLAYGKHELFDDPKQGPAWIERDKTTAVVVEETYYLNGRPYRDPADGPCQIGRSSSGELKSEIYSDLGDAPAPRRTSRKRSGPAPSP